MIKYYVELVSTLVDYLYDMLSKLLTQLWVHLADC